MQNINSLRYIVAKNYVTKNVVYGYYKNSKFSANRKCMSDESENASQNTPYLYKASGIISVACDT